MNLIFKKKGGYSWKVADKQNGLGRMETLV